MEAQAVNYVKVFATGQILFGLLAVIAVEIYRFKNKDLFRK